MGQLNRTVSGLLAAVLLIALVGNGRASTVTSSSPSQYQPRTELSEVPASTPILFTENLGQWNERVRFRAEAGRAALWFTADGAYYQFVRRHPGGDGATSESTSSGAGASEFETMIVKASFVGGNRHPGITGLRLTDYRCNYFAGNDPDKWVRNAPSYEAVIYSDIYEGIDLKYYAGNGQMEYDFIVDPGADPSQIMVRYEGAGDIEVNDRGELVVTTDWGTVTEHRPLVYQAAGDARVTVACQYALIDDCVFGFLMPEGYNRELALVIDPVLTYSTYLGGADFDHGVTIGIDDEFNLLIAGTTMGSDIPLLNPLQTYQGDFDHFITKLNPSGSALVFSTYIGGTDYDEIQNMVVDHDGRIYLTGLTRSADYPTVNPVQGYLGSGDAFATKLSANGDSILFSTYLGGTARDKAWDLAVDDSGNTYIAGETDSEDFPVSGPIQGDQTGQDAFAVKLNAAGSLVYSTYLGSSGADAAVGIAVDLDGNAYLCGSADASDFPQVSPVQAHGGLADAFVAKLNSAGDALIYSTFLGGSLGDRSSSMAIDSSGRAHVCGSTYSEDFPLINPYQTDQGGRDVFITRLNASGTSIEFSTYLGSSEDDGGFGIAVDGHGSMYVLGLAKGGDFPQVDSYQPHQNSNDAFVAKFEATGTSPVYSSIIGGGHTQSALDIVADDFGRAFVTGLTTSDVFPVVNPIQPEIAGQTDAFLFIFYSAIDSDGDGVEDLLDNCVWTGNPGQEDSDADGIGDICDACTDIDGDGFGNPGFPANECALDNCPDISNPDQVDSDADGVGDVCDRCPDFDDHIDADQDSVPDLCDNCPETPNPAQTDSDGDNVGDACCCLPPTVGDVDQSGTVDISDIQMLIDNQFLSLAPLGCPQEGDVDNNGTVDITDLSVIIDNQFLTLSPLPPCP